MVFSNFAWQSITQPFVDRSGLFVFVWFLIWLTIPQICATYDNHLINSDNSTYIHIFQLISCGLTELADFKK